MRKIIFFLCLTGLFYSCKKADGGNAPEIKFKDILDIYNLNPTQPQGKPILTIQVKDADGDIGFNGNDTSFIFIKNVTANPFRSDSFAFPTSLSTVPKTAYLTYLDVLIDLNGSRVNGAALAYRPEGLPSGARRDSTYYEVYIKDFAKHKSNIIRTDKPIVVISQ